METRDMRTGAGREPVNLERLHEAADGDEAFEQEIVSLFLEDTPPRLEAIRRSIKIRDAGVLEREAHGLKGAAGSIGADQLRSFAGRLESLGTQQEFLEADPVYAQLSHEFNRVHRFLNGFLNGQQVA